MVAFTSAGDGPAFTDQGYPVGAGMYEVPRPPDLTDPNAYAVEVSGASMKPKYLDGQVVIVDTRRAPVNGDAAVVGLADGRRFVKIWRKRGGKVTLESVNPGYDPITIQESEVAFAHKVLWVKEK